MGDIGHSNTSEGWNNDSEFGTEPILLPWHTNQDNTENLEDDIETRPLSIGCYSSESEDGIFEFTQSLSLPWYTDEDLEESTSASPRTDLFTMFVGMGFPKKVVKKALAENGESDMDLILETLLTYSALDKLPDESGPYFPESEKDIYHDFSDSESYFENKEGVEDLPDNEEKLLHLIDMGFPIDEASSAIKASGPNASIAELMDFICASQMSTTDDAPLQKPLHQFPDDDEKGPNSGKKRNLSKGEDIFWRRQEEVSRLKKKRVLVHEERKISEGEEKWIRKVESYRKTEKVSRLKQKQVCVDEDEMAIRVPMHMIGFGLPRELRPLFKRDIPEEAAGPPFFYYENVALAPKGVWSTISRFLFEIKPEFVDSLHFCAAARKRGYIHNLPIHNRFPLQPIPHLTIQEVFPLTQKWWPPWDDRTHLNCLNTCHASAKLTQRIRDALEQCNGEPHVLTQKWLLYECKKWNLVWTGKHKAAPLEPDEMETLLGYPKHHTRGVSTTDRYKALGNSFQVDTVAYHLSVLKKIFPNGINVLSLFSGIGGAEVALHRLGIKLNNVVSVEISEVNRTIIRSWWEGTNQKGKLIELADVEDLSPDKLEDLTHILGGFDLIIGGSPCNNLTGSNRRHRVGLKGEQSVLFYDYFRILNTVKSVMANM